MDAATPSILAGPAAVETRRRRRSQKTSDLDPGNTDKRRRSRRGGEDQDRRRRRSSGEIDAPPSVVASQPRTADTLPLSDNDETPSTPLTHLPPRSAAAAAVQPHSPAVGVATVDVVVNEAARHEPQVGAATTQMVLVAHEPAVGAAVPEVVAGDAARHEPPVGVASLEEPPVDAVNTQLAVPEHPAGHDAAEQGDHQLAAYRISEEDSISSTNLFYIGCGGLIACGRATGSQT